MTSVGRQAQGVPCSRPQGHLCRLSVLSLARSHGGNGSPSHPCTLRSAIGWRGFLSLAPVPFSPMRPHLVRSAEAVDVLGRELTSEETAAWQESCAALSNALSFSPEECNRLLARAFGWTSQAFWRREKVEELPSASQVAAALSFLRDELSMPPEEQRKVVLVFPEVLACDVQGRLRANVAQLQTQWRLQGPTLTKAVLRQPHVLGYSLDCGGDCIGECNRCWARF